MKVLKSVNPYSGEELSAIPELNEKSVSTSIQRSSEAFTSFSKTSFEQRSGWLAQAASCLRRKEDDYAGLITSE